MRIHIIQHVAFEGPGAIAGWARERGHSITVTEQFSGGKLPAADDLDFLVVMGGPMGANDDAQFAWLAAEKQLIAEVLQRQKAILGICLGAQLLAQVMGAPVYRNREREIGWFPVRLTAEAAASRLFSGLPPEMTVLHWHGDTFDLPQGAAHLAESDLCRNQAFELDGRALGLQFHLEVQPEGLERLIANSAADLALLGSAVQRADPMRAAAHHAQTLRPTLDTILDRLAEAAA
jgi:GMP synthase-like glutamine amidotransferase